ncbi:hypothetical protein PJM50_29995, partial [Mycobacterium kansasii]
MSNDAFYFGILPVLSETASHYGITAAEMARASITGQPFHMQSPWLDVDGRDLDPSTVHLWLPDGAAPGGAVATVRITDEGPGLAAI